MRWDSQIATPLIDHTVKAQKSNFPEVTQLIMSKICMLLVAVLLGTLILISISFPRVIRKKSVSIALFS